MLRQAWMLVVFLGVSILAVSSSGAQSEVTTGQAEVGKAAGRPPDGLSESVRGVLAAEGLQVSVDGAVVGEAWVRKELPASEKSDADPAVRFAQLGSGSLVGAVRFPQAWTDYKGKPVPAGTYTLRYGLEPADGNHIGLTLYRDFLLLIPAAEDVDAAAIADPAKCVEMSRKATGSNHPAVMALFPLSSKPETAAMVRNELDQWVLATSIGPTPIGLVFVGQAEVEGY